MLSFLLRWSEESILDKSSPKIDTWKAVPPASGGNFDRPAWKQLIAGIEAGNVEHLLVKDLSRVGRYYLHTPPVPRPSIHG